MQAASAPYSTLLYSCGDLFMPACLPLHRRCVTRRDSTESETKTDHHRAVLDVVARVVGDARKPAHIVLGRDREIALAELDGEFNANGRTDVEAPGVGVFVKRTASTRE